LPELAYAPPSGPAAETGTAPPRARRRRRRRPTDAAAPEHTAEAGTAAEPVGENAGGRRRREGPWQGEAEGGGGDGRERRAEGRGRRDSGPRDRSHRGDRRDRGGRGAPPKRAVPQKLYSVDSIVDRGFEDVEEEEGETRRVHWTIVKRTTAEQNSRKPVATV
jgi:hypothetical protein